MLWRLHYGPPALQQGFLLLWIWWVLGRKLLSPKIPLFCVRWLGFHPLQFNSNLILMEVWSARWIGGRVDHFTDKFAKKLVHSTFETVWWWAKDWRVVHHPIGCRFLLGSLGFGWHIMKEVLDLARRLNASFHHDKYAANKVTHVLAKESFVAEFDYL